MLGLDRCQSCFASLNKVPPALSATALTVYSTLGIGLATTLVTLASGPLYAQLGARAFWVMAVL
jgi:PPP family 3-phenylpropionic acid transporter